MPLPPVPAGNEIFGENFVVEEFEPIEALALRDNEQRRVIIELIKQSEKAYQDDRYDDKDFQITNQLSNEVISLPMHTELDDEQIEFITSSVLAYLT